jgi:hypothetical protein
MKFNTYQNKKLKAIQIMALKAWLKEDWDEYFKLLDRRDVFEECPDKKEYNVKYRDKPENYNVMPY